MARRPTGDGSVYPASRDARGRPTSWRGAVVVGWTADRKPIRRYVRAKAYRDAVDRVRELQAAAEAGTLPLGRIPTVAEWLTYWLDVVAPERIRPSTARGYRTSVHQYLIPELGRHRLDALTAEHIELAYSRLLARPLKPATVLQAHRVLSRALKIAVRRRKLARNPVNDVDGPGGDREEAAFYTTEQVGQLLDAAEGDRLATRWSVALALGLRQGEALGLTWGDVDLDAGTLSVRRALQRVTWRHGCDPACGRKRAADCPARHGGGLQLVEVKSKKSRRTIPLPTEMQAPLRARRAAQAQEQLVAGDRWRGGQLADLVWTQLDGAPIDPRRDWAAWRELCDAADLDPLRLHDARHTAASLMLLQGVHPKTVQAILGHSSFHLTMDTYSHVAPELAEEARAAMGRTLAGRGGSTSGSTSAGRGGTSRVSSGGALVADLRKRSAGDSSG